MSIVQRHRINFHPQEVQALLKACLIYKVEQFRQAGKSTGHLFYDIQQEMAKYGEFPERPLFHLRAHYRRVQKRYKQGRKPYPPEARELWGRLEEETDDQVIENDETWKALTEQRILLEAGCRYLTKSELAELIREATEKDVEIQLDEKQKETFKAILNNMHSKKLFVGRNADDLLRTYHRMKKRFLKGKHNREFPESAAKLWTRVEAVVPESVDPHFSAVAFPVHKNEDNVEIDAKAVCSLCQGCAYEFKHLFRDMYQNQTYAEIINQTLNVKMVWNGQSSAVICQLCSTYVEGLPIFWKQCRESCVKLNFELVTKEEPVLEEPTFWGNNSGASSPAHDIDDAFEEMLSTETPNPTIDSEETHSIDKSKALSKDQRTTELTREELNMLKFKESLPSSSKRKDKRAKQCDLCGKTVIDLKTHLDSHYNVKSHACDLCPKMFTSRHQLRSHRNTHTGAIKYACSYCDAVFDVWQSKKYHEKKHVVEMNNISYNCDQCNATFKVERNLQHHIKFKHLQMRKLQCSQCDFATINKTRLVNHVRSIHSKERPFQCPYCSFNSNSNTGYFIHFKRHKNSGEAKVYHIRCGYCEETFLKDSVFEKHILQDHPDRAIKV
ncbi:zinc finger and SCAN domain-containing protein 12 [Culex quinquefasciatus]|uniref:Zinc finger and SCAN domain-containing protein 12 n=1 Tax=Culex quinquefasciatus TaxID=7176 RepID=B0XFV7_CULQU|nr:zinc finger and SCAN domain-containing protein 12 [Culex quinquefasciatus]|eukprot:XP_001868529.1 zinc finger and SCAN domain-containing protein 12 [Culex quinquefasciatus]